MFGVCRAQCAGSRKCLSANPGRWPLVTRGTLDDRLRGKHKKAAVEGFPQAVLTPQERADLVETMRLADQSGHPFRKKDRDRAVCEILEWRQHHQQAGRGFRKLSPGAKTTLRKARCTKSFWSCFFSDFPDLSPNHKVVTTSIQRAKQCSRVVAAEHCDTLKASAAALGIYDIEADRFVRGKSGNLLWLDEMNQFFNYLLSKGNNLYRTAAAGKRARAAANENRGLR